VSQLLDRRHRSEGRRSVSGSPSESTRRVARSDPEAVSTTRAVIALVVAMLADSLGALPGDLLPFVFDLGVGAVLAMILGPRVAILGALLLEAVPVLGLFPSWVAAVAYVAYSSGSPNR
jgi:hypothetical protein